MTDRLRAQLSMRLRTASPAEWGAFTNLWMAFNALYGGEPDARERARVMGLLRRRLSEAQARLVLNKCTVSIDRILAIPPGDMRLDQWDPNFRRKSRELSKEFRTAPDNVARIVALGGILYQIRCNLIHGGKDPAVERDRMLIRESIRILDTMIPLLEKPA